METRTLLLGKMYGFCYPNHMTCHIRRAQPSDAPVLQALDTSALSNPSRADAIVEWLRNDEVFLAAVDDTTVGYAVLRRRAFFGRDYLEMLMIDATHRGQRIGETLLLHIEKFVQADKFFITTNLSNHPMQRLLTRLDYRGCGFIDQLDLNDPEIVFTKKNI